MNLRHAISILSQGLRNMMLLSLISFLSCMPLIAQGGWNAARFVHDPPNSFPDQPEELKDNTHFNSYAAYELARAIVQNIRDQKLSLARYLNLPIPRFDPAHPDPFSKWQFPPSPGSSAATPYARCPGQWPL